MRTIRTVTELRAVLSEPRRARRTIGLVPTMGAFHDGHLSLIRRARAQCDVVVVSLFVNPAQFNETRDLDAYPRDEERDAGLADGLGVDYLFAPAVDEVYPPGFATTVSVGGLTETLEGESRGRGHFDGVTTVVTKLFNMVGPDVAYFGQKDAQQALVVTRLVRDLDMPVRIEVCATIREPDGLAMSSRNVLLSDEERRRAIALRRALLAAEAAVAEGIQDPAAVSARALAELSSAKIEPEYLALVSPETLEPVDEIAGDVLALVAARVGTTRLIDNERLSTEAGRPLREAGGRTAVSERGAGCPAGDTNMNGRQ
jgi:pantoate--beta-alanine ligase